MIEPDWNKIEERLFKESGKAIDAFEKEHSDKQVCYFSFDSEPAYGYVLICFDTTDNSLRQARENEQQAVQRRKETLNDEWAWKWAKYQLSSPQILPFNNNAGDFMFQGFRKLEFPEWQAFRGSKDYPQCKEGEGDYLEGRVTICFWNVIERLIEEGKLQSLPMSSPFYLGYGFHDEDQVVLRILNCSEAP